MDLIRLRVEIPRFPFEKAIVYGLILLKILEKSAIQSLARRYRNHADFVASQICFKFWYNVLRILFAYKTFSSDSGPLSIKSTNLGINHRSPEIILPMSSIRVRLLFKVRGQNHISVSSLHRRSISESPRQEDHQLHDHFRHGYLNTMVYDLQHDLGTCGSRTVRPPWYTYSTSAPF